MFDSIYDLTHRVEWQDILSTNLKVINEYGELYVWDEQQELERGCVYGYTMIKTGQDPVLASLCNTHYTQNSFACEFTFR